MKRTFRQKAIRYTIATLGVYEAIAIVSEHHKLPTISALAWHCREDPLKRALILFPAWSWLTFHLFTEEAPQMIEDIFDDIEEAMTCTCR